jgi:hypothetical protein
MELGKTVACGDLQALFDTLEMIIVYRKTEKD